jgi:hypothetical protein
MVDYLQRLHLDEEAKMKRAVSILLLGLPQGLNDVLCRVGLNEIEFFLTFDAIALLIRRTARITAKGVKTIQLRKDGSVIARNEVIPESLLIARMMACSPISEINARYVLRHWLPEALTFQPHIFLGLDYKDLGHEHENKDGLSLMIVDRNPGDDLAVRWKPIPP